MNCCTNETNSPRSMVSVGHFDFDYRYNYNASSASADGHNKNEDERQEEQMLDVLSMDQCNQYIGESKKKASSRSREEIIVETVGIHSVDSSSNGTVRSQASSICDSQKSARQCLGVETKTEHATINFYRSPSHLKEDVEMEFRGTSGGLSHRTTYFTGPEHDSVGSLSTDSDNGMDDASSQISIDSAMDLSQAIDLLREAREQLSVTKKGWKSTQRQLRGSIKEIADLREKAQLAKRELKIFNQDWESQQNLLRNKDKELERLRLIIADRTLQLTEKTGELSITKVALVSSENGLSACRTQVTSRNEDLRKAHREIVALRKALSDTKAELSRTKLQLDASAERRRQFSNKAMRLLLLGEDSVQGDNAKNNAVSTEKSTIVSPRTLRARAKSWSGGADTLVDADTMVAPATPSVAPEDEEKELASASVDDCPAPYSFSAPSKKTKEIGIQASFAEDESATRRGRDRAILRPTRSPSMSCDKTSHHKEDSNGTNQKSLDDTAAENADTNCEFSLNSKYFDSASKASTMDAMTNNSTKSVATERDETVAEIADTNCGRSLNSKYFDSASKASTMDAIKSTATNSVTTEEDIQFFDSTSKTPSASGSKSRPTFPETNPKQQKSPCAGEIVDSSDYDTAFQSENDSLRDIETTPSAISHLTDPTVTGASDASFITSAVTLLKSHSQQFEDDFVVQQKGNKWKSMLKSIKSKHGEEEAELMSATGSSFDDVSSCNSYHSVTAMVQKNATAMVQKKMSVPAGSLLVSIFVVFSVTSAFIAKGEIGVTYAGGVLSVSDSRLIAGCASLVLILIMQSIWNVLTYGVTRVYSMLSP